MSNEMINKVAKAINPKQYGYLFDNCPSDHKSGKCKDCDESREELLGQAKAAIQAMREQYLSDPNKFFKNFSDAVLKGITNV